MTDLNKQLYAATSAFGGTRKARAPAAPASDSGEAVLYLRVSDKKQMATDSNYDPEGNSIPTQRRITRAKAAEMGVVVAEEYVEPGRSATSIEKRRAFQKMIADLRTMPNVRYVIVYMMNRAFRNALEELTTKAELAKMGVKLISAKESFGDSYLGDAMQAVLAVFNELQSRANGEDIKTKLANKARNGGTVTLAPLGYLNVRETSEGREFRTVIIDPVRGPLVRLAFELYAAGDWSLADLSDELFERGLHTRPRKGPEAQVSYNYLSRILRNRYYIGIVRLKGEEHPGRHEPLVSQKLFARVQEIIQTRTTAEERRRVHHHYLKGSLFCGACAAKGITQRMVMQHTVNRHKKVYQYFFCRGKPNRTCHMPYIPLQRLEEAVEDHYATIRFTPEFITTVRAHITTMLDEHKASTKLLHEQIAAALAKLGSKEDNLLDLAADGELPQDKIKARLRDIRLQKQRLTERLEHVGDELPQAAQLIELALTYLQDPQATYLRCDDHQRRVLNQAIFHALYVEKDGVTGHKLKEPLAHLHALQTAWQANPQPLASAPTTEEPPAASTGPQNAATTPPRSWESVADPLDVLLGSVRSITGSNSTHQV